MPYSRTPGTASSTGGQILPVTRSVGFTGSGADYICDGTADDVEIQAAVTEVCSAGGGVVQLQAGTYIFAATVEVPKDPKLRIEGPYTTKAGYGGAMLRTAQGVNLTALIRESGTVPANLVSEHSHASHYARLVFDGQARTTTGLVLLNTDHSIVSDCKFVGVTIGIDGQHNGPPTQSELPGGLRVQGCSLSASQTNIQITNHTQDWITDSWFTGSPTVAHIRAVGCNKLHFSNNEFNTVNGSVFLFEDAADVHCGDINITGGFINAGTGKPFWTDNRTNANSKGVVVAGVRLVTGVRTKFFQQAKEYQGVTYTADTTADANDQVILLNGTSNTVNLSLPACSSAINTVWVKAINITNAVTITPNGSDTIDGAATYTFAEVNESVLLNPDGNRWRLLDVYKPTGGASATAESVVETASAAYTLGTATDVLLVNAASNAVTVTLPSKSSKSSATRKTVTIKVINAANPVTIQAAGADELDAASRTSITVRDTRSVVLIANTGTRWRTYSTLPPAPGTPTITAGAGAGTGATVTLTTGSTDSAGEVTVTAGTGTTAGAIATITYGVPLTGDSFPVVTASNAALAASGPYVSAHSATATTVSTTTAVTASTAAKFTYRTG